MPPRLDLLTKRRLTFDLPILPFLAPRVFAPWPHSLRSYHSGSPATVYSETSRYSWEDSNVLPQTTCDVAPRNSSRGSKDNRKEGQKHDLPQSKVLQGGVGDTLRNPVENKGGSWEPSELPGDQDDLKTKYEEIWGGLMRRRPPESPVALVTRVMDTCQGQESQLRLKFSSIPTEFSRQIELERIVEPRKAWFRKSKLNRISKQREHWMGQKRIIRRFKILHHARGLPKLRLKYVRVTPEGKFGCFKYSSWWNWRFAMLCAWRDGTLKDSFKPNMAMPRYSRVAEPFIRKFVEKKSSAFIRQRWMEIPLVQRGHTWQEIMLTTLAYYPSEALGFLKATFMPPYPPGFAVSDSLDFIISHYNENRDGYGAEFLVALSKTIRFILEKGPADHVHLSQRTLFRLLHMICLDTGGLRCTSGKLLKLQRRAWTAKNIYRSLAKVGHPMHENTLLQFASGLAKNGDIKTACRILQRLRDEGSAFNSPKMLSLCSTLLQQAHRKMSVKDGVPLVPAIDMFRFVLEAGAESNPNIYNILMKSSLDTGNHEMGWKIFETMTETGLKPDAYTYSILLNDAKLRMDASAIRAVMDHVRQNSIRNDWIITDVLHAILLLHKQERQSSKEDGSSVQQDKPAFDRMLHVYCNHFHLGPLAQIIPNLLEKYPGLSQFIHRPHDHLHDPPRPTLVVMVTGYLDNADTPHTAMEFYENFRRLIIRNDPVVVPLTMTTHVWNLVLMVIGRFSERLADCSNLVGDMLSGSDQSSTSSQSSVSDESTTKKQDHTINTDLQLPLSPEAINVEPLNSGERVRAEPQMLFKLEDVVHEPLTVEDENFDSVSDSSSEPLAGTEVPEPIGVTPPKPDVYTWSILLKIFMDHHQPRAAEKVLKMMSERQITPSQVTWNKLAVGYARMQDTAMTVDVLRRLEATGLSADPFTMSALGLIKRRRALIDAMRRTETQLAGVDSQFLDGLGGDLEVVLDEEGQDEPDAGGGLEKVWAVGFGEEEEEEWW
ncbi:hypothetical protein ONS95_003155 [Cadophora gregata]|uniref:uncharacterized protein n=1 Tax=Cadophora gregata TaxID=51156 RepID=UPI0026DBBEEC|nr:uncharacterized protein ONS95_003155 [Cadophora gregata]KAK0108340.1 hypothetical protein ONS95_003155 [Cadophora gregata]KAK0109069.1 hypothetical protein ONS96_002898 [Cadophora gregata f. sp. sojae]